MNGRRMRIMFLAVMLGGLHTARADDPPAVAIDSPGLISQIILAGSGRIVLAGIPSLRKIAVIDLDAGKTTSYLSVPSDDFLVGAGATKAVVVLKDKQLLQRWDLATGKLDLSTPLPVDPAPPVIGCASEGPVLIGREFVDLKTLKRLRVSVSFRDFNPNIETVGGWGSFNGARAIARPDGTVFAAYTGILRFNGNTAEVFGNTQTGPGSPAPAPEVDALFPAAWAAYGNGGNAVMPAVQPQYVVRWKWPEKLRAGIVRADSLTNAYELTAVLQSARPGQQAVPLPALPEMSTFGSPSPEGALPVEKRLIVDVEGKRVVTVPASGDKIFVHRFETGSGR
jgi:hypothetical protein